MIKKFNYININNINNYNNNNNNSNNTNNINNISNINNNNQNNQNNHTKNKIINIYNLGTIRILLNFENPIINDFSFYSPINTDKLKNIENLECKTLNLVNNPLTINFDKDICGYLGRNLSNKGQRLFKDYLDCFESTAYYCNITNINSELYIVSKGPIFNQIEEKYDFNNGKNKKLLFIIKQK